MIPVEQEKSCNIDLLQMIRILGFSGHPRNAVTAVLPMYVPNIAQAEKPGWHACGNLIKGYLGRDR